MGREGLEKHPVSEPALDRLPSNTTLQKQAEMATAER